MHIVVVQGTDRLIHAAIESGAKTTFIGTVDQTEGLNASDFANVVLVPSLRAETVAAAVAAVHRHSPVNAVLSLTESGVLPAAYAAEYNGVAGVSLKSAHLLQDKLLMRRHLTRANVPARAVADATDIVRFMNAHPGPVILKPRRGTASRSIFRIENPDQAVDIWSVYQDSSKDDALVEGYARGNEYSVEAFSHAGHHHIVSCTEKLVSENFVELGHTVPADLVSTDADLIARTVTDFLSEIGVDRGPTHTEIRIHGTVAVVVESHNRIGGDKIAVLVDKALGVDLAALTIREFASFVDCDDLAPSRQRGAAIRFLRSVPGQVERVIVPDNLPNGVHVSIAVEAGDVIGPLSSSADRSGYVIAEGITGREAADRAADIAAQIRIEIKVEAEDGVRDETAGAPR